MKQSWLGYLATNMNSLWKNQNRASDRNTKVHNIVDGEMPQAACSDSYLRSFSIPFTQLYSYV